MDEIRKTYTEVFQSINGQLILKELETVVLTASPFSSQDVATDALLREGARILINHIYEMQDNNNN